MKLKHDKSKKAAKKQVFNQEVFLNRKIVSPQKLKILVLAGNQLISDQLQFLAKCINLIKLDVSHNNLTRITQKINFENLTKLEVLHVHNNRIANVEGLAPIFQSPNLTYFTFHHNPIEEGVKVQHEIINCIESLKVVNNRIVYVEERSHTMFYQRKLTYIDEEIFQNWKSVENTEIYYLRVLNFQLQYIDNVWAFNNPIIYIQRAWRHFLPPSQNRSSVSSRKIGTSRSKMTEVRQKSTHKSKRQKVIVEPIAVQHALKQYFKKWKLFSSNLRQVRQSLSINSKRSQIENDKSYLLLPLKQYYLALRNMKIRGPLEAYVKKIRRRIYEKDMVKRFRANIYLKKTLFGGEDSFYYLSGINQFSRFYYNKNQQHILENFLILIAERFNKREAIYDQTFMKPTKNFSSIRLLDPDTYSNKYTTQDRNFSFCSLLWPSMKMVIVNRRKVISKFKASIIGIRQLTYIKNRDKIVTQSEYEKSVNTYRMLQKFAMNEYENSLYYFECKDEFVMKHLLRMIYYHNSKALTFEVKNKKSEMLSLLESYEEPFMIYVDKVMKRNAAAVLIQKTWRRFISNKNQKESIYTKMKKNRAALHIQRFFRDCIFKHRQYFQKKLYSDLAIMKSQTILFPIEIYMNLNKLEVRSGKWSLFKNLKITRQNGMIGANQQFLRPLFSQLIREKYLNGGRLGMQSHQNQIDFYNLLHYGSTIKTVDFGHRKFISVTYKSKSECCLVASIISLITYQFWGRDYIFPLTLERIDLWPQRFQQYSKVKITKGFFKNSNQKFINYTSKQIKQKGVFLYKLNNSLIKADNRIIATVEFYQKRFHDFPQKFEDHLAYSFINFQLIASQESPVQSETIQPNTNSKSLTEEAYSSKELKNRTTFKLKNEIFKDVNQTFFNIASIDKKRFSLYDFSVPDRSVADKTITEELSKTQAMIKQSKKEKVMRAFRDEYIKRQAQKEMKNTNLALVRQKAKKQKSINMTMLNMKELQRTEMIKTKVNKVKQFKNRRSEQKRQQQADFVQQNNFVMQQQLKMVIMRNKMKQIEHKKEQLIHTKRQFSEKRSSDYRNTIQSRKSSKNKIRGEEEEPASVIQNIVGQQGSIINTKKHNRKSRTHSIGAHIRDPSFVHGVFPEQYYPIENRSTLFFPPV